MLTTRNVQVRRVCDVVKDDDGAWVLVDQLWSCGMPRATAALDEWCKDVSPSTGLRTWCSHDPAKLAEFTQRYKGVLKNAARARALGHLHELTSSRRAALLTVTKAADISEAPVLADLLRRYRPGSVHTGIIFWKEANHD